MNRDAPEPRKGGTPAQFGPFRLDRWLGSGTSGEVWAATHGSGFEVALKIGPAKLEQRRRFMSEARSAASLSHPNVLSVFDLGVLDADAGRFGQGTPYLVLERGDRSFDPDGITGWAALRSICAQVSRGLAHFHAFGLVHRDIKPANIVLFSSGAKLADFGVTFDTHGSAPARIAGTPMYMAPEQLRGEAAELGPWTDIFALGVVVWRVTTGTWPYPVLGFPEVATHFQGGLPAFVPRFAVPDGLRDWLDIALQPDRLGRFRSAAEALHVLPRATGATTRSVQMSAPSRQQVESRTFDLESLQYQDSPPSMVARRAPYALPISETRPAELQLQSPEGMGHGLRHVRELPFVGRKAERDRLWASVRDAFTAERCTGICITGPPGSGKTRLGSWLGRMAHEAFGATFELATVRPGLESELVQVLRQAFRVGNGDARAVSRLRHLFPARDPSEDLALANLLQLLGLTSAPRTVDPARQAVVLSTTIKRIGRIIVMVDAPSPNTDIWSAFAGLLEHMPDTPLVLVVTGSPAQVAPFEDFATTTIDLGAFEANEVERLIDLINPPPALADQIRRLKEPLPALVEVAWSPADDSTVTDTLRRCLATLTTLGSHVETSRWMTACALQGLDGPTALEFGLANRLLVQTGPDRVMGRQTWTVDPAHSQAVFEACMQATDPAVAPAEYGQYAIGAGRFDLAVGPLRDTIARTDPTHHPWRRSKLARLLVECLEHLGSSDAERVELWVSLVEWSRGWVRSETNDPIVQMAVDASTGLGGELRYRVVCISLWQKLTRPITDAQVDEWTREVPALANEFRVRQGLTAAAVGNAAKAHTLLDPIDPTSLVPRAKYHYWRAMAELHWHEGDISASAEAYGTAYTHAPEYIRASGQSMLGHVLMALNRLDEAETVLREALAMSTRYGQVSMAADAMVSLGQVMEKRGDFTRAIALYTEAQRVLSQGDSVAVCAAFGNLALVHRRVGDREAAERAARAGLAMALRHSHPGWAFALRATLLGCLPMEHPEWAHLLDQTLDDARNTGFRDPDILRALEGCTPPPELVARLDVLRSLLDPAETSDASRGDTSTDTQ